MSNTGAIPEHHFERVQHLRLVVTETPWDYAAANSQAIARHWQRRSAENPAFFNGRVFVLRRIERTSGRIAASFSLEAFADFLFCRDHGYAGSGILNGYGSALVRSAEGHVMLGRSAAGTLNAGNLYLPGGFLDARDARPDGLIDLEAAIARELTEETGLDAAALDRVPGYLLVRHGHHCAFVIAYRSSRPTETLRQAMQEGARRNAEQELSEIVAVRDLDHLARLPMPDDARFLLRHALVDPA